ncbi:MAG: hypothetical protein IJQ67_04075 [Bacilli bacterium]|nr:hypothetical protein [Bacilli bacterium]
MRFPSKVTPYKDSIFPKLPVLLRKLKDKDYTVSSLYMEINSKMTIREYIDALDCLYAMRKITLKEDIVHYVERNIL